MGKWTYGDFVLVSESKITIVADPGYVINSIEVDGKKIEGAEITINSDVTIGVNAAADEAETETDKAVREALDQAKAALEETPPMLDKLQAAQKALTDAAALEGVTPEQKATLGATSDEVAKKIDEIKETEADTAYAEAVKAANDALNAETKDVKAMQDAKDMLEKLGVQKDAAKENERLGLKARLDAAITETSNRNAIDAADQLLSAYDAYEKAKVDENLKEAFKNSNKADEKEKYETAKAAVKKLEAALLAFCQNADAYNDVKDKKLNEAINSTLPKIITVETKKASKLVLTTLCGNASEIKEIKTDGTNLKEIEDRNIVISALDETEKELYVTIKAFWKNDEGRYTIDEKKLKDEKDAYEQLLQGNLDIINLTANTRELIHQVIDAVYAADKTNHTEDENSYLDQAVSAMNKLREIEEAATKSAGKTLGYVFMVGDGTDGQDKDLGLDTTKYTKTKWSEYYSVVKERENATPRMGNVELTQTADYVLTDVGKKTFTLSAPYGF